MRAALALVVVGCGQTPSTTPVGPGDKPLVMATSATSGSWTALSSAGHVCGLTGGKVTCWGYDHFKQIGVDPPKQCKTLGCAPVPCALGLDANAVAVGENTSCIVDPLGDVECWGEGNVGQLGALPSERCANGEMNVWPCSAKPHAIAGVRDVKALAVGTHVCALTNAGDVWCWGNNNVGQLGGTSRDQCVPNLGQSRGRRGEVHTSPPLACSLQPIRVPISDVVQIAVGRTTSYALTKQGEVYCWGDDEWGQCPTGKPDTVARIASLSNIAGVAGGVNYACAWSTEGKAWCWGANSSGHIGKDTMEMCKDMFECSKKPRQIAIDDVVEISAGFMHACARKRDGRVACWGLEREHLLGFKATDHCGPTKEACERAPKVVPGIERATAVSVGVVATCVLVDGRVKCWGINNLGALGDGTTKDRSQARDIAAPRTCR
ncbi:MAG TPA: hypothetical protein VIV11_09905 [Kofleriaceae bacterium]